MTEDSVKMTIVFAFELEVGSIKAHSRQRREQPKLQRLGWNPDQQLAPHLPRCLQN